jgi:ABC-type multidrug transport system fused ATPase/permease subunit
VKEGIGDKLGMLVMYITQFVAGFIIAFAYSWQMTLVMLALTPLLAACGMFMAKVKSI